MANKLTRERIEAAIELIEEQKEQADRECYLHDIGVSSSLDIDIYERVMDAFETLLALANAELDRQSVNNYELIKNIKELVDSLRDTLEHDVRPHCHDLAYSGLHDGIAMLEMLAIRPLQNYKKGDDHDD